MVVALGIGIIYKYILENSIPIGPSFVAVLICACSGILFSIATRIIDKYLMDHIVIRHDCLTYAYSKIFSGKTNTYHIDSKSKLIWSVKMENTYENLNMLYLVDSEKNRHVILGEFRINPDYNLGLDKFFNKLKKISELEIIKESD